MITLCLVQVPSLWMLRTMSDRWRRSMRVKSLIMILLILVLGVTVIRYGLKLLGWMLSGFNMQALGHDIVWVLFFIVVPVLMVGTLVRAGVAIYQGFRDNRTIAAACKQAMTRSEIEQTFNHFRWPLGRHKFVSRLAELNVKVRGTWSAGFAPNKQDRASELLAQLDEKWLGLDR